MNKHLLGFLAILFVGTASLSAQTIGSLERQVIASSGEYLTGGNMTFSCTVGEPIVKTLFNTKLILTQGFQQPIESDPIIISVDMTDADWSIKAYPNPFQDYISVEISSDKADEFTIDIRNVLGQTLSMQYLASHYPGKNVYNIETANLSQGMYVVTVQSKNGQLVKSFKLNNIR